MTKRFHFKKVKKDYQRKNLPNPFFRHSSSGKNKHLNNKQTLILIFLSLIFLIWFFLLAPFWRIQNIIVIGLTRAPQGEINKIIWDQSSSRRWVFFKQSNIFLFDDTQASKNIIDKYNVAAAEIKKEWPHTLKVVINERPYAFIFQEGTKLFYASADGYIIKQPPVKISDEKKYFLLENDNPGTLISNHDRINIKANHLSFIFALDKALASHPDLPVGKFIIDSELNTVKVKFINGPVVYFNVKDSINRQINILLLVKNRKIKDNFKRTKYIDLRYGNRVFVNPNFN